MENKIYEVKSKPLTQKQIDKIWGESYNESRLGYCECGSNRWILMPEDSDTVKEGGKFYLICYDCGSGGMHL